MATHIHSFSKIKFIHNIYRLFSLGAATADYCSHLIPSSAPSAGPKEYIIHNSAVAIR